MSDLVNKYFVSDNTVPIWQGKVLEKIGSNYLVQIGENERRLVHKSRMSGWKFQDFGIEWRNTPKIMTQQVMVF